MNILAIIATLSCLLPAALHAASSKILASDWQAMSAQGAALSYALEEDDRVRVRVQDSGSEVWHAQLRHLFEVQRGHKYRITLTLESDKAHDIPIWVQQDRANFEIHHYAEAALEGSASPVSFTSEFVAIESHPVYLLFALGKSERPEFLIHSAEIEDLGVSVADSWERKDQRPGSQDFAPRVNFGRRLEPENSVLLGAGQDFVGFADYVKALDDPALAPVIFMEYAGLYENWDERLSPWRNWIEKVRAEGRETPSLQLGLYLVGKLERFNADSSNTELERIASSLQSLNAPVFLRIGYEPNGPWNSYPTKEYISAFRRISTYLRERLPNVAVVWCIVAREGGLQHAMKWYPGDDFVDWWGIDLFSVSDIFHPETREFLVEAENRRFPVMIGESTPRYVGVLPAETAWNKWFDPFFALVRQQSVIKAICYINWNWPVWAKKLGEDWERWGDARIETSPDLLPKLREEFRLPLYQKLGSSVTPELISNPPSSENN
jgi:hypothetical protein